MADDLPAKRDQKPRQAMQQKQTEGRGFFRGAGSNQPKPRAGREQTAQGGSGERATDHAACPSAAGWALRTRCWMAWRLNLKVSSAEAW